MMFLKVVCISLQSGFWVPLRVEKKRPWTFYWLAVLFQNLEIPSPSELENWLFPRQSACVSGRVRIERLIRNHLDLYVEEMVRSSDSLPVDDVLYCTSWNPAVQHRFPNPHPSIASHERE